jgi:hypothetical protein
LVLQPRQEAGGIHVISRVSGQCFDQAYAHARSLRGVRDGIQRRMWRLKNGLNRDDLPPEAFFPPEDAASALLKDLQRLLCDKGASKLFHTPEEDMTDHEDLRVPSLGLPADCVVKPKHRFLVLKPQIALRSEVDENSIILLAVEEISFKGFSVLDEIAKDEVAADVLGRYATLSLFSHCD